MGSPFYHVDWIAMGGAAAYDLDSCPVWAPVLRSLVTSGSLSETTENATGQGFRMVARTIRRNALVITGRNSGLCSRDP